MIEKIHLHNSCLNHIERSIQTAQDALEAAIAAGNEETKSSAGDKHETGRAMMQMEQNKNREILMRAITQKSKFLQIDPHKKCTRVEEGALVKASNGCFYIIVSIGKIIFENEKYYAISAESPLARAMMGKTEKDTVSFQNKQITIIGIS